MRRRGAFQNTYENYLLIIAGVQYQQDVDVFVWCVETLQCWARGRGRPRLLRLPLRHVWRTVPHQDHVQPAQETQAPGALPIHLYCLRKEVGGEIMWLVMSLLCPTLVISLTHLNLMKHKLGTLQNNDTQVYAREKYSRARNATANQKQEEGLWSCKIRTKQFLRPCGRVT